jgi:tetratricopeptide (TPR) repeat protein
MRLYAEGRKFWDLRDPRYFETAILRFGDAVAEEPGFALAWAALADAYNLLGAYDYGLMEPVSARRMARMAADSAVALSVDLAEAQAALATVHFFYEWEFRTAEALYNAAIRSDERYSHAFHWLALLLAANLRFDEALRRIDQAIQIGPSAVLLSGRARILYFSERFSEARDGYREALRLDPHHVPALLGLGLSALMDGDSDAAMNAYARANERLGGRGLVVLALQGHLYGQEGDEEAAARILDQLQGVQDGGTFVPPEYFAMIHLGSGNLEEALDYLYDAFDNRSNAMTILKADPLTRPLRDLPRFQELIRLVWEEESP